MLSNYLKVSWRNIRIHKGYSLLNVGGLAVGMACCLMIWLFVEDELGFDRWHENAERIYRVIEEVRLEGVGEESASMPFPAGDTLPMEYPDMIEASVRFFDFQLPTLSIEAGTSGEKRFNEPRFFFADAAVFRVFTFPLLKGDPTLALRDPNTVAISESTARKYFEGEDPIGKILRWQGAVNLRVTGIFRDMPANSHIRCDFLASFSTLRGMFGGDLPQGWYWNPCWTYLLLKEGARPADIQARFPGLVQKYFPDSIKDKVEIKLQPLTDIHLHSHLDYEISPNSDMSYIYIFSAVAVFVLLIACINFMNLSTARSSHRGREAGLRKVLGAHRPQLVRQFLGESILLCLIASLLAVLLVEIGLPAFNAFSGKSLSMDFSGDGRLPAGLALVTITVGLFSGLYPAIFLSGFDTVLVLKGTISRKGGGTAFRRALVVVQFAISIFLIIGTTVCFQQLHFLRNSELGFDKQRVVLLPAYATAMSRWYEGFKERVLRNPRVRGVTAVEDMLGAKYQTGSFIPEGAMDVNMMQIPILVVMHDFIETFDIAMTAGRSFSRQFPTDISEGIIINRSAAAKFGWEPSEAVGKRLLQQNGLMLTVVGVTKDFYYTSLAQPITPFILEMPRNPGQVDTRIRYVAVKVTAGNWAETLAFLKTIWDEMVPNRTFESIFLDEELDRQYDAEEMMGRVFGIFSGLAILIATLGLLALASFTAEMRTREIGIRKVLGARVSGIVMLLSREFTKWVLIANLIAWPAAYLIMDGWLSGFAHRISLGYCPFLTATLLALAAALITVSFQAVKAARADPVHTLRHQ